MPMNEPTPNAKTPPCPAHLSKEAKTIWRREAKRLHRIGLLTEIDGIAMAMLSDAHERWVEAKGKIEGGVAGAGDAGEVLKTHDGNYYQNPWVAIRNRAWTDLLKILAEFGMTPSSRSRTTASPKAKPTTTRERLFGKGA